VKRRWHAPAISHGGNRAPACGARTHRQVFCRAAARLSSSSATWASERWLRAPCNAGAARCRRSCGVTALGAPGSLEASHCAPVRHPQPRDGRQERRITRQFERFVPFRGCRPAVRFSCAAGHRRATRGPAGRTDDRVEARIDQAQREPPRPRRTRPTQPSAAVARGAHARNRRRLGHHGVVSATVVCHPHLFDQFGPWLRASLTRRLTGRACRPRAGCPGSNRRARRSVASFFGSSHSAYAPGDTITACVVHCARPWGAGEVVTMQHELERCAWPDRARPPTTRPCRRAARPQTP